MSHRYDVLLEGLKKNLFVPSQRFHRKWVVIPSDWLKDYLLKEIAVDPRLGIATGLRFLNLNLCVKDLVTLLGDRKREMKFPRREGLAFFIERQWPALKKKFPLLEKYLEGHPHREIELADTMAHLMMKRTLHAEDGVEFLYDWQQEIEKRIFSEYDQPQEILEAIPLPIASEIELELHLFGFHDMPALYIQFFEKLATRFHVVFYHFSPSPYYWGDVLSEKGSLFLEKKLALQGKVQEAAAPYFVVQNALLAEGVEAAKPLFHEMIDRGFLIEEEMELQEEDSALALLQNDLLEMQTSKREEGDESLQLHAAPTLLREVQVIRMLIEQMSVEKGVPARAIRVYCTNMNRYGPYIEYVFGDPSSRFGFVCDNTPQAKSGLFEAYIALLNCPQKLMTPEEVFTILKCKAVLQRWNLTTKDFDELLEFVLSAKIDFGFDASHRQQLHVDLSERGSWLYTINQWILSLAFAKEGDHLTPPFEIGHFFPFPKSSLLQSLIDFVQQLQFFYQKVVEKPKRSLFEWTQIAEKLLEDFFAVDEKEDEFFELETLRSQIQNFRYLDGSLAEMELEYESLRKRLVEGLSGKETRKFSQDDKEKISFLGIKKGQIVSADHIFIMGFDEEAFPSRDDPLSLIRLSKPSKRALFMPSKQEMCLFLQIVLQARKSLIFTYCQQTEDPESLYAPSPCFSLIKDYGLKERVHSLYDFSPQYFEEMADVKSFSLLDFTIANRLFVEKKPLSKLPEIALKSLMPSEEIEMIDLKRFAAHPLRFFMNHQLGIYLDREEEDLQIPGVMFSYLDRHQFLGDRLEKGKKETLRKWELSGRLPYGLFEKVALTEIEEQLEKSLHTMQELLTEDLFQIEIDPRHREKKKISDHTWVHPPIEVDLLGRKRVLSGVLKRVSATRFFAFHEQSLENLLKIWPEVLLYKTCFPAAEQVVFLQDQTTFDLTNLPVKQLLEEYILYYEEYQKKPSWLLPKWGKRIFSEEDLWTFVIKNLEETRALFPDEYLLWFFEHYPAARNQNKVQEEQKALQGLLQGMKEHLHANF